jgi:hypothetical protein
MRLAALQAVCFRSSALKAAKDGSGVGAEGSALSTVDIIIYLFCYFM